APPHAPPAAPLPSLPFPGTVRPAPCERAAKPERLVAPLSVRWGRSMFPPRSHAARVEWVAGAAADVAVRLALRSHAARRQVRQPAAVTPERCARAGYPRG